MYLLKGIKIEFSHEVKRKNVHVHEEKKPFLHITKLLKKKKERKKPFLRC